ncbi:MAG: Hint domain-containing protein [Gemmobacter sp.]
MFLHPARHFADARIATDDASFATTALPGALIAGTRVETAGGWRDVAHLRAGDRLQTFDGGLRPLIAVEQVRLVPEAGRMAIRIEGGTLGACDDLTLLPGAQVLIATGKTRPEAARALVPALSLRGVPGVVTVPLDGPVSAVRPVFADDEVIWANTGVLLFSPGPVRTAQFPALDPAAARHALARRSAPLFRRAA